MQPSDSHETAQENVGRPTLLFGFIPLVPLAFLGLGIYRAWIEIAFVGSFTGCRRMRKTSSEEALAYATFSTEAWWPPLLPVHFSQSKSVRFLTKSRFTP